MHMSSSGHVQSWAAGAATEAHGPATASASGAMRRCSRTSLTAAGAQIFSSDAVQSSGGVYWMFYAGSCFEEAPAPAGLHGLSAGAPTEGLRCASCMTGRLSSLQQCGNGSIMQRGMRWSEASDDWEVSIPRCGKCKQGKA